MMKYYGRLDWLELLGVLAVAGALIVLATALGVDCHDVRAPGGKTIALRRPEGSVRASGADRSQRPPGSMPNSTQIRRIRSGWLCVRLPKGRH